MPLVSVIIPVYNVENYVEKCVRSVTCQRPFADGTVEIIMVDDGSTDSSGMLCDKISGEYDNITVIHQQNGGLGNARNTGIKNAKGKYIQLLDSDDTLENDALENIIGKLSSEPDVLICRYNMIQSDTGEKTVCDYSLDGIEISSLSGEQLIAEILTDRLYHWYAWLYVLNREFIEKNSLWFTPVRCCEDAEWSPRVLYFTKKAEYLDKPVYNYLISRNGSLTKLATEEVYRAKIEVIKYNYDFCQKNNIPEELKNKLMGNLSPIFMALLADNPLYGKEKSKKYLAEIKKYDICLKYSPQADKRLLYKTECVIGIDALSRLLYKRADLKRKA